VRGVGARNSFPAAGKSSFQSWNVQPLCEGLNWQVSPTSLHLQFWPSFGPAGIRIQTHNHFLGCHKYFALVPDTMHFLRRFGGPIAAIVALIGLSVIAVVSIGEGFKSFLVQRDGNMLRRRDGSTLTFSMPWK
jgi:hypothetical protein